MAHAHSVDPSDHAGILALRGAVAGEIVLPGDPSWDEARRAWNLAVDQRPFAVALIGSVEDVVKVVDFARENGLRVAPQGTGHGASALAELNDTILVKMSRLRGVEIDAGARRARIEAGALWEDVVEPAAEQGFVVLHGSSPDVGVVGYTLGGGMGWLARSRGLAANSVTAVELVTADGNFARIDDESEPDLFWAVRGGGGSFGVVTALELELYPTPDLYAGAMFWPVERAGEVLRRWREWAEPLPDEVTTVGRILHFPPFPDVPEPLRGNSVVIVEAVFVGSESEGTAIVAPLRELEPVMDTFAAVGPRALQHLHMDPPHPVPGIGDGLFLEQFPGEAIDAVAETGVPPLVTLEIRQLGGVMAGASDGHGAVGSLDAGYVMFTAGMAPTPEIAAAVREAVDRVKTALAPWESERTYFNFSEQQVGGHRLYPLKAYTYQRLRRIKAAYDPAGVFVANHPIPPAAVIDPARLASAPLFSELPAAELDELAAVMGEAEVEAATEVTTADESGTTVYLIEEGSAGVTGTGGPTPIELGPGDTFGEIGLLLTGQRTATVVARTPMRLLSLSGPDFERIRERVPEFESSLRRLGLERSAR
ncbi:MAG TPA: FAD-binding protein [Gaiellaceae bacterium]|jgi:FAD/FMN-containing dehydrogenase|nr:FAD-binding protein [Gaiellaceae bacterium]